MQHIYTTFPAFSTVFLLIRLNINGFIQYAISPYLEWDITDCTILY